MNFDNLVSTSKTKKVRGLPRLKKPDNVMCKQFQLGKMKIFSFKRKNYDFEVILSLVHTDLYGPDKYFILFVDDYSRMMIVMFLQEKYDAFKKFKWYLARFEKEIDKILKCPRSNRGGEFISRESNILCNDRGIKRQMFAPKTPPHNGIAKRRNRSIMDCVRTLMMEENVASKY